MTRGDRPEKDSVPVFEVSIRNPLTLEQAEHAASAALKRAQQGEHVQIDLTHVRTFEIGAASRIGNSLRLLAERARLTVVVPVEDRGLERIQRSGIGPQIAAFATAIANSSGVDTARLRRVLSEPPSLAGTSLLVTDLARHPSFLSRRRSAVRTLFDQWLGAFPADRGRLPEGEERRSIVELVAEAATNVLDHSDKRPWTGSKVNSYLYLTWRSHDEVHPPPEGFAGEDESSRYLNAVLDGHEALGPLGGLLEMTVADDGVGISARQALDAEIIRERSVDREIQTFAEALAAGGTVKLRARDCPVEMTPGYGSAKVLAAIRDLAGFASIRSGRLVASVNCAYGNINDGFAIEGVERALISGVVVTVLVPVFARPRPRQASEPQERLF